MTPNIEISGGVRYWGLASRDGDVRFGPSFATGYALNNFDHQRYGVLLQVKGKLCRGDCRSTPSRARPAV